MVAAHASGMEDAEATTIDLKLNPNVKRHVLSQPEKIFAIYRKFMDHVLATIPCGITIATVTRARNLFTVVVLAMPIDSRKLKIVKHSALPTIKDVSIT
jgi:hypothetical protein